MYAIDFGTGQALVVWSEDGEVPRKSLELPTVKGGKTPRDEFNNVLTALLNGTDVLPAGDVVCESPTIGSSGAEPNDVRKIIGGSEKRLYVVSARLVKNWKKTYDLPPKVVPRAQATKLAEHQFAAAVIYGVAVEQPERLKRWRYVKRTEKLRRKHTSVRPSDKRGYRDSRSDAFMELLPAFSSLPKELQATLGVRDDYSRSLAMPFAMALTEPYLKQEPSRDRFEKLIGLYDHGYPSFYRRMTVAWMQRVAKLQLEAEGRKGSGKKGNILVSDITPEDRKQAWKTTRRQIRMLYRLAA